MIKITRRIEWDAAHRITTHESKCATLHGHRYAAEITVTAPDLDQCGRVIDFSIVKDHVGGWVDRNWDHTTLLFHEDAELIQFLHLDANRSARIRAPFVFTKQPTAENIAAFLLAKSRALLPEVTVVSVTVWETPTSRAVAR